MKCKALNILILFAAICLSACSDTLLTDSPFAKPIAKVPVELVSSDEEIPVHIGYSLFEDMIETTTRASVVGGDEYTPDYVQNMFMLCFTEDGIYLGYRRASFEDVNGNLTHESTMQDGCPGRELFTGTVPAHTARIHFVANLITITGDDTEETIAAKITNIIPNSSDIGGLENNLMRTAKMSMSVSERQISYWGFVGKDTPDEMKAWLAEVVYKPLVQVDNEGHPILDGEGHEIPVLDEDGNPIMIIDHYTKKEGSVVHLLRDRARIDFSSMADYYRTASETVIIDGISTTLTPNRTDYQIISIDWLLVNGLERGYIAPFKPGVADHFDGYCIETSATTPPTQANDRLSPYDKAPVVRYGAVSDNVKESEMLRVYEPTSATDPTNSIQNPPSLFLFEDKNEKSNPPKIVLKAVYQKYTLNDNGTRTIKNGETVTKYHTVMLLDAGGDPFEVYRNHVYKLSIYSLPWEGLGYVDETAGDGKGFRDAVNSTEYANNRTVSISDKVTVVNDGQYELTVKDSYVVYQTGTGTEQTLKFYFNPLGAEAGTSGVAGVSASNFNAKWQTTPNASLADPTSLSVVSYDPATGEGVIKFTLGTIINANLQHGVIELTERNSGMTRNINIYSITQFDNRPLEGSNPVAIVLEPTGGSRTVSGRSCPTYKLTFRLPSDFPEGLFPLKVRMASSTLSPFRSEWEDIDGNSHVETEIAIEKATTENSTVGTPSTYLDGEVLSGMNYSTTWNNTDKPWNYRATGSPWNFWYNYVIVTKPETTIGEGDAAVEKDIVYTIYLDDVRPLRAAANQADNVGLFLKIKYFGDATALTAN